MARSPRYIGLRQVEKRRDFKGGNIINRQQVLAFEKPWVVLMAMSLKTAV